MFGDLYVGVGSDRTILDLKGRHPIFSEKERLYLLNAIRYVKVAFINSGNGILDFKKEFEHVKPDVFVVNEDGYSPEKQKLCDDHGAKLKVLMRVPDSGLPAQSTTSIQSAGVCNLPYRIDLAGTWIDQTYVSKFHPGWAITLSLEPIIEYNERCGMATSTRNAAKNIWPVNLPFDKPEKLAKILFKYENEPGSKFISGAQDAIGICMPGLVRHYYNGEYWPMKFESIHDNAVLDWLEDHLSMVLLWPRKKDLDPLKKTQITSTNVKKLADAADACWHAIRNRDLDSFKDAFLASFNAQTRMFPAMLDKEVETAIDQYKARAIAWKLSGAGGGGYLILVGEKPLKDAMKIKIRRQETGI